MSLLGGIAALPYQLGDIATIIPPAWKSKVTIAGFGAAFLLRVTQNVVNDLDRKPKSKTRKKKKPATKKRK